MKIDDDYIKKEFPLININLDDNLDDSLFDIND